MGPCGSREFESHPLRLPKMEGCPAPVRRHTAARRHLSIFTCVLRCPSIPSQGMNAISVISVYLYRFRRVLIAHAHRLRHIRGSSSRGPATTFSPACGGEIRACGPGARDTGPWSPRRRRTAGTPRRPHDLIFGEGGIRTLDPTCAGNTLSRRAPSSTWVPLHGQMKALVLQVTTRRYILATLEA